MSTDEQGRLLRHVVEGVLFVALVAFFVWWDLSAEEEQKPSRLAA